MTGASSDALVLGLGNLIHSDDGLGVHAIQQLERDHRMPPGIALLDGGTQGLSLIPHIAGCRRLLVIDAVDVGEPPGTILRLQGKALDTLPGKASVHQVGFADLMIALKLLGEAPEEVVVIGVQPMSTDWNADLTPPVRNSLDQVVDAVIAQLQYWVGLEPSQYLR
jgi:hydrogenase maturation protease